jgi:hypothetical protein
MSIFVATDTLQKNRFRCCAASGIIRKDSVENLDSVSKLVEIKMCFCYAKKNRWNKLLRWQKANRALVFLAIPIKDNEHGCPLEVEIIRQGLCVRRNSERYNSFVEEFDHFTFWIRNCIHLLATNSARVEEIDEYRLLVCLRFLEGGRVVRFPLNRVSHDKPPFLQDL